MKNFIQKASGAAVMAMALAGKAMASSSSASFFDNPQGGSSTPKAAATGTLGANIAAILNYGLGLLGLVAVGFLIYSGVLMVTAGGNEEQTTKAKKIIMYAVGGIIIILLSYTIVTFVTSAL